MKFTHSRRDYEDACEQNIFYSQLLENPTLTDGQRKFITRSLVKPRGIIDTYENEEKELKKVQTITFISVVVNINPDNFDRLQQLCKESTILTCDSKGENLQYMKNIYKSRLHDNAYYGYIGDSSEESYIEYVMIPVPVNEVVLRGLFVESGISQIRSNLQTISNELTKFWEIGK